MATFVALSGLGALLGNAPAVPRALAGSEGQGLDEQAVFEVVAPEGQWSPRAATEWQTVLVGEVVTVGDRVRTGPDARARLIYFEGSVIEVGPSTGLLVVRLERTGGGDLLTNLLQTAGTTVSRVRALIDPAASFEIETPTATAIVRGTQPRVQVAANGTTRVANEPDNTGGRVQVVARDAGASAVTLAPGEETDIRPGQPPLPPVPIGTLPPFDETPAAPLPGRQSARRASGTHRRAIGGAGRARGRAGGTGACRAACPHRRYRSGRPRRRWYRPSRRRRRPRHRWCRRGRPLRQ